MANVLVVNASDRPKSNSRLLAAKVAEGAKEKGHHVETADIGSLEIKPCRGCEACVSPAAPGCVVMDDMQGMYRLVENADILIFSSPIYWFNLCGQIKQFIDRCYAIAANRGPDGRSPYAAKKIGAVLVYGDTDPFNSGAVNALRSFQDICAYTGAAWAGAVYGSAYGEGELADNPVLLEQAKEYGAGL